MDQGRRAAENFRKARQQLAEALTHLAAAQAILGKLLAGGGRP
jgi:hypothetical protein